MANTIELNKQVFDKSELDKTINTSFSQLINTNVVTTGSQVTVEEFFSNYESLFYQIPKNGINNSHEYLVKQSGNYIGQNLINDTIQALLEEIQTLREENIALLNQISAPTADTTTDTTTNTITQAVGFTVTGGEFIVPPNVTLLGNNSLNQSSGGTTTNQSTGGTTTNQIGRAHV